MAAGEKTGQFPELHTWLHPELQQILQTISRAHCPAGIPAVLLVMPDGGRVIGHRLAAALPSAEWDRQRNNRIV